MKPPQRKAARPKARVAEPALARAVPGGPAPLARPAPRALVVAIGVAFAMRVAATLSGSPFLWGLDILRVWPHAFTFVILALGALGFVPAIGRRIEHTLDALGNAWQRRGAWLDVPIAAALGILLYTVGDPLRFVGDSDTRWSQLMTHVPTWKMFPQSAPLDRLVNIMGAGALVNLGLSAEQALRTVGAVVGFVLSLVMLTVLREAGATRAMLPAAALVALGGAALLHCAGYDKFGPLLVGTALTTYGALRLARRGDGAWAVGVGGAIVVLAHRSGYALLPAIAWILARAWSAAEDGAGRRRVAIAAAVLLVPALVLLPRAIDLALHVDRTAHFATRGPVSTLLGTGPLAEATTRGIDGVNLLFLLVPLWPVLVASILAIRAQPAANVRRRFSLRVPAALAAAAGLIGVFWIRGAQGPRRDWDIHTGFAAIASLAGAVLLIEVWRRVGARGSIAPLVTTALVAMLGLWGVQASEAMGARRVEQLLEKREAWNDASWAHARSFLGMRALRLNQLDTAITELKLAISAAPNPRYFYEVGMAQRQAGRPDSARVEFEHALSRNRDLADAWVGLAILALDRRDYPAAVALGDSALMRAPYRTDAREVRDLALQWLGGSR